MTQAKILEIITNENKPVAFDYADLRHSFGFVRMSGKEFLLLKILRPSMTEKSASYLPDRQIRSNIETFAILNNLYCTYNYNTDRYIFELKTTLPCQP